MPQLPRLGRRASLSLAALAVIGLAVAGWRMGLGVAAADHTYDPAAPSDRWRFSPPVGRGTSHPIFLAFQHDWGKPSGDECAIAPAAWKARMTALTGLAALGPDAIPLLMEALDDPDDEVRDLASQASGYFGDRSMLDRLDRAIREDRSATVRIYATIARAAIAGDPPQELVKEILRHDPHSVVRARLELTLGRGLSNGDTTTRDRLAAYDLSQMDTARLGALAPDFVLSDLNGKSCRLSDFRGKNSVVLVFVYGVTCMYCTGQVATLRHKIDDFEAMGAKVLVLEANEPYRVRATARGASLPAKGDPRLPILYDSAHTVAATYGVAMQMNHVEWLNRPSTFLIDRQGILREAILADSPGDRPSPEMVLSELRRIGNGLAVTKPSNAPASSFSASPPSGGKPLPSPSQKFGGAHGPHDPT